MPNLVAILAPISSRAVRRASFDRKSERATSDRAAGQAALPRAPERRRISRQFRDDSENLFRDLVARHRRRAV